MVLGSRPRCSRRLAAVLCHHSMQSCDVWWRLSAVVPWDSQLHALIRGSQLHALIRGGDSQLHALLRGGSGLLVVHELFVYGTH